jgi:hypothetical protein
LPAGLTETEAQLLVGDIGASDRDLSHPGVRTLVFDAPRHTRSFFETLIADNLDIGRPRNVEIIFGHRTRRMTPPQPSAPPSTTGITAVRSVNVFSQHSRIEQYPERWPRHAHRDRHQQTLRPSDLATKRPSDQATKRPSDQATKRR